MTVITVLLNSFGSLLWVSLCHLHNADDGRFLLVQFEKSNTTFLVERVLVLTLKCSDVSSLPKAVVPSCGHLVRYRFNICSEHKNVRTLGAPMALTSFFFFLSHLCRGVLALLLGTKLVSVSFMSSTLWQNFSP